MNGQELTLQYLNIDVLQVTHLFENFLKTSAEQHSINPLYSYSQPGYTWKTSLKLTNINLDLIHSKELLLPMEDKIQEGFSSVMGERMLKWLPTKNIRY